MRQAQVGRVERAEQRARRFHQVSHFIEQNSIFRRHTADRRRQFSQLLGDQGVALGAVDDHARAGHDLVIIGGVGNVKGRRVVWPQTACRAAAAGVAVGERNHLAAQQGHEPADGTRESNAVGIPAHGFAKAEAGHQGRQQFLQHLRRGPAGDGLYRIQIFAAGVAAAHQVAHRQAVLARKAFRGPGGLTLRIERGLERRPLDDLLVVALARGQSLHLQNQAPWGACGRQRAEAQASLAQALAGQCF